MNKESLSFIIPTRNNLKYLKWSYASIRKNLGEKHEICIADDFSNDGTLEWLKDLKTKDKNIKVLRNNGPTRLGHTILYDELIKISTNDIFVIWHADMYATPDIYDIIKARIYDNQIVSITRIEPPLHPSGPEKIVKDFGTEPENFKEKEFLDFNNTCIAESFEDGIETNGIFAPWACSKKTFLEIGGHDRLYYPQSKEDSDIFNRLKLHGCEFVQSWDAFVYHLTCRGSRFNPTLTTPGKNSTEWDIQNIKSSRNFIRKWGHFVKHDKYLHPIIEHKYNIGFYPENLTYELVEALEPWCDCLYFHPDNQNAQNLIDRYIENEQKNTMFDLHSRLKIMSRNEYNPDGIEVFFDCNKLTNENFNFIVNLSEIIKENKLELTDDSTGDYEFDIFTISVNSLNTYEKDLIRVDNTHYDIDLSNIVEI